MRSFQFFSAITPIYQLSFEGTGPIPTFFFGLVCLKVRGIIASRTLHENKFVLFSTQFV